MNSSLRSGFTTGAAAAAAAKAALLYLINKNNSAVPDISSCSYNTDYYLNNTVFHLYPNNPDNLKTIHIKSLSGKELYIPISSIKNISDNCAEAVVIKDGGDDPDVTHNAEIGARVVLKIDNSYHNNKSNININSKNNVNINNISGINIDSDFLIIIKGGIGVGVVTKPGLEIEIGNPAINSGPQKMICEAVESIFINLQKNIRFNKKVIGKTEHISRIEQISKTEIIIDTNQKNIIYIEIFVPKGEELAKKTLNARLGILGGISILGTTGIVKPMSHDAYIATIKSGISVAKAMKNRTIVFTTGRRSERFAADIFPNLPEESFIQIGDFFKASIESALKEYIFNCEDILCEDASENCKYTPKNISVDYDFTIIIVVFFGKAVKMAMGFPHTHAAKSELTMKTLAKWAEDIIYNPILAENIALSNTARHAFTYIYPDFPEIIDYVGNKIVESANNFANNFISIKKDKIRLAKVKIRAVILDFEGKLIFDSDFGLSEDFRLSNIISL